MKLNVRRPMRGTLARVAPAVAAMVVALIFVADGTAAAQIRPGAADVHRHATTSRIGMPVVTSQPLPKVRLEAPDTRQLPVPLHVSRRVRPFGVVAWWPWNDVVPIQPTISAPMPLQPLDGGPLGGLQLDVEPRRAQVYVDSVYAGLVEDFSGYYRHLQLTPGPHVITIVAPDYAPLALTMMVVPDRTITYRGTLTRASGR